jgi:hypothetical protein
MVFFTSFNSIPVSRPIASRGVERLGRSHFAFFADRTFSDIDPGEPEQLFLPGLLGFLALFRYAGKKTPTGGKLLLATFVPQQAVMPDLDEPVGKNVKQGLWAGALGQGLWGQVTAK